ncbi:MAG: hypothetical protein H0W15_06240 [Gemmatimonadales bacterium]|nr:hypothetical protein [Gemmatimonadales bacterium]
MSHPDRRRFLGSLGVAAAATTLPPFVGQLEAATPTPGFAATDWDLEWVKDVGKARHKQVFDMGSVEAGLHVPTNYLDAFEDVMKLKRGEVLAVIGIASNAFPMNASDALWAKFPLGERWKVTDPDTGTWAARNLFAADPAPKDFRAKDTIATLVARGTIFWQCHNALMGLSRRMAPAGTSTEAMYEELKAGLLPHVKIVPAHTMLIGLVQEHGCTYEKI